MRCTVGQHDAGEVARGLNGTHHWVLCSHAIQHADQMRHAQMPLHRPEGGLTHKLSTWYAAPVVTFAAPPPPHHPQVLQPQQLPSMPATRPLWLT
jgi:hypothetical protein